MNSPYTGKQQSLKDSVKPALLFILLLWAIKIVEAWFNLSFHFMGVFPLSLKSIGGIITAPLIHGSFEHLAGNSLALFILFSALFFGYPKSSVKTTVIIWFGSGFGTWLFAREAWHFGASGLTHGLFFFLLLSSMLRKDKRSIALMMIAFFMYGGMLMSIFPREVHISFEYHLFGAVSGAAAAFVFRHADPKLAETNDDRESKESSEIDYIGDQWQMSESSLSEKADDSQLNSQDINLQFENHNVKFRQVAESDSKTQSENQ